jgi:hypothetical protein
MIVSRIWAGLGNQLFQYAAGKCQAALHKTVFKLDCRWFSQKIPGDTPRSYELDHFNVHADRALDSEIRQFPFTMIPKWKLSRSFLPRWQLFLQKRRLHSQLLNYREMHFHFDPKFFDLPSHVYLIGYFQSERYFKPIEEELRKEFAFKTPPSRENEKLLEKIQDTQSVSLHVRRGDYALDPRVNRHHGLCDLKFYQNAIEEIARRVDRPHFFVFSDDIPWVKNHLQIGFDAVYVTNNQGKKSYEDLRLMSSCRHHIIANSSFSWWGAWLNPRADKIVFAPRKWTNVKLDLSDLIPSGWMIL